MLGAVACGRSDRLNGCNQRRRQSPRTSSKTTRFLSATTKTLLDTCRATHNWCYDHACNASLPQALSSCYSTGEYSWRLSPVRCYQKICPGALCALLRESHKNSDPKILGPKLPKPFYRPKKLSTVGFWVVRSGCRRGLGGLAWCVKKPCLGPGGGP